MQLIKTIVFKNIRGAFLLCIFLCLQQSFANAKNVIRDTAVFYKSIAGASVVKNQITDNSVQYSAATYASNDAIQRLRDTAKNFLDAVTKSGAWVSTFGENATVLPPFGIKKKIGGTEYQVAISNIDFGMNGGVARVFARALMPQTDANGNKKEVYFTGYADLTRVGGVVSDGKLQLIGNDSIKNLGDWSLALKGNDPSSPGKASEQTYFSFDCSGFKELGIIGEVVLSKDVFIPVNTSYQAFGDTNQVCSAPVNVVVNSFGSLLVNKLKFSKPFMMKKTKDYAFRVDEAMLDFSDTKNPEGTTDDFATYLADVQPDEPNTWEGLIITKMQVFLPSEFRMKDSKDRVSFTALSGIIDATGFSTVINQKNILPLDKGRAGTWGFSVDEIGVYVKYSELNGGSLAGKLVLPIQSKSGKDGLSYFGKITKDGEYEITVGSLNDIKASFWKAKLQLDKSSSVSLIVQNGQFLPKVNLSGKISFNMDGNKDEAVDEDSDNPKKKKKAFSCDGIVFEELQLQTVKPYFQVKSMGVEGKLHIASFEAEYSVTVGTETKYDESNPKASTQQSPQTKSSTTATSANSGTTNTAGTETASLNIALDIKIMDGKIGGKTKLAINAVYNDAEGEWQFDNVELGMIGISADFGKAKFEGELAILKNDDVYGNALAGSLKLKVNKFELGAKGIFGRKDDFRYWSVDGMAKGFKIQAGPITFTGFTGGVTYKMDVADKESPKLPSGILYVPSNDAFLRVRAGVLFDVMTKELITATAGFEIVFNSNWGVNSISLNGTLRMLAGDDNKDAARMKGSMRKFANPNTSAAPKEDASVWGDIFIKFDFENAVYSGVMNSYVNFADYVIGGMGNYQSGRSSFYVSDDKWYIYIGTDKTPNSLKLNGPINVQGTGYFMMGNDIPSPYGSGNFALKHGMSASITLSAHLGWIWAEFGGGLKYDVLLMHTHNFQCNGGPAGLNGWFGEGRVQAYMYGAVGMHFHISMPWFLPDINYSAEVFRASINANLFLSGPKPFYVSGHLDGRYSVWIFHGSFGVTFSKGTKCGAPPPPPIKLNAKDQAIEDDIRARRDVIVKDLNDLIAQQTFETSKNYLKKANTNYFDAKLWVTPLDITKNEALLVQAKNYLADFRRIKASEPNILSKRDPVLAKFNDLLKAEKSRVTKDTLKAHITSLTEEKSWATPIDQQKANTIIDQENAYFERFKKIKESEADVVNRRDSLYDKFSEWARIEASKAIKDTLKLHLTALTSDKNWSTPINRQNAETILKQEGLYLERFTMLKASELNLVTRRDNLLARYNTELSNEAIESRKTALKTQIIALTEDKNWSTPINQKTSEAIIIKTDQFLIRFQSDKELEKQLIAKREELVKWLTPYQKTFLEKDPGQRQLLTNQFNQLSDEKKWTAPLNNLTNSKKTIEDIERVIEKYKKDKEAEQKENELRLQNIDKNKQKQKEYEATTQDLNKKLSTEKSPTEKVKLTVQLTATAALVKALDLEIKRDELLVDLTKQLNNADNAGTITSLIEKINKLKSSTAANLEANINSIEKAIVAEKEAKRKEEERIAAEQKALQDLQQRQTNALEDAPKKMSALTNVLIKSLVTAKIEALKKAQSAADIKAILDELNTALKTKY
ncbi:MAG: hypothetical protein J0I09_12670 [Sphingobacteriia bacterium]|nr:hypothetical protein [Sphingobacteriia bacterium]